MRFTYSYRSLIAILISSMVILSCSSSSTGTSEGEEPNTKITEPGLDAELSDDTEYMDDETVAAAMTDADNENQTYTLFSG